MMDGLLLEPSTAESVDLFSVGAGHDVPAPALQEVLQVYVVLE